MMMMAQRMESKRKPLWLIEDKNGRTLEVDKAAFVRIRKRMMENNIKQKVGSV